LRRQGNRHGAAERPAGDVGRAYSEIEARCLATLHVRVLRHRNDDDLTEGDTMHYPLPARTFFVVLACIFIVVAVLIEIRVLRYAYLRSGVSSRIALFLRFSSSVATSTFRSHISRTAWCGPGSLHPVVVKRRGSVIAVNVGGGLISTLLSL
jgi:hypothetical protein